MPRTHFLNETPPAPATIVPKQTTTMIARRIGAKYWGAFVVVSVVVDAWVLIHGR